MEVGDEALARGHKIDDSIVAEIRLDAADPSARAFHGPVPRRLEKIFAVLATEITVFTGEHDLLHATGSYGPRLLNGFGGGAATSSTNKRDGAEEEVVAAILYFQKCACDRSRCRKG